MRKRARRPPAAPGHRVRQTTVAAVGVVAAVAGVVSYMHMHELAERAGEGWRAWVVPLAVDGLVVAASMTMLTRRRAGKEVGWLPWISLLAGIAASLAANVAAAEPTIVGRAVASWPPVALLLAYELLMDQIRIGPSEDAAAPAAVPASLPPADCRADDDLAAPLPQPAARPAVPAAGERHAAEAAGTPPLPVLDIAAPPRLYLADALPAADDPDALRQAARQHYREVLTAGGTCTGRELADRYGMSERWGRDQRRAVEDELALGAMAGRL